MMLTKYRLAVALAVVAFVLTVAVGCGPKPPCPVQRTVVKAAQDQTAQTQSVLDKARAEGQTLEKELAQKQARLDELKGKPAELAKKLDNLKKGSGR